MDYRPLDRDNDEIRLLSILPSPGYGDQQPGVHPDQQAHDQQDLVQCQLLHYSFQDAQPADPSSGQTVPIEQPALNWSRDYASPASEQSTTTGRYSWGDYLALSYEWGNPNENRDILLNGNRMKVGRNLESALRVLRDKQPVRIGYKLWIDALCINQQDKGERGQEVKRMHRIYKDACAVVVWLGPEADESDKGMSLIHSLSRACETGKDRALGDSLREHPELLGKGSWRALSRILDRTYWNRLWILQEVALGGHQTAILCGQEAVTWQQLFSAIYTFGTHNTDIMFSLIDRETREVGMPTSGLNRNRIIHLNDEHSVQNGKAEEQVMCMLDLGRKSLSTDPRDKVYGLLGMMKDSVVSQIKVDYNADLSEVFTKFAKAFIVAGKSPLNCHREAKTDVDSNEDNSLEILEQCTWHKRDMPSWVPDWTDMNHYRLFSGKSTYFATKNLSAQCRFLVNQDRVLSLYTRALRVDEVDGLASSYYEQLPSSAKPKDGMTQSARDLNVYSSKTGLREAVWRTLVGNRTPKGEHVPDDYRLLLDCVPQTEELAETSWRGLRAFSRLVNQNAEFCIAGRKLRSFFPSDRPVIDNPKIARNPMERMFRYLRTRRLITTSTGFLGTAPRASQKADCIFLIPGCNVPLVLRPCGGQQYKVVGGCYLHGFMEGEAVDKLSSAEFPVEEIILS